MLNRTDLCEILISLPFKKLSTIMQQLGQQSLDVLKNDVEGDEYGVLQEIVDEKLPVDQIAIKFDDRFFGKGFDKTMYALHTLRRAEYVILCAI